MISAFIHLNNPFLCLKHIFICRLHSLCLQFKSFCPVMWIYNQNNSSVSGRSGCFGCEWRVFMTEHKWSLVMWVRVYMAQYKKTHQDLKWYFILVEQFHFRLHTRFYERSTTNMYQNIRYIFLMMFRCHSCSLGDFLWSYVHQSLFYQCEISL